MFSLLVHLVFLWLLVRWVSFSLPGEVPPANLFVTLRFPGDVDRPPVERFEEESRAQEQKMVQEAPRSEKTVEKSLSSQTLDRRVGLGEGGRRLDEDRGTSLDPSTTRTVLEKIGALRSTRSTMFASRTAWGRSEAVGRYGGSAESEEAVDLGLEWLARHQAVDGRWDANGFVDRCREQDRCTGYGLASFDPAQTGLALLAFLGAGHTHRSGEYVEAVRRGLEFLLKHQASSGLLDDRNPLAPRGNLYNHSIALMALAEAYGMTRDVRLLEPVARGVGFLALTQQPGGGWTYIPFWKEERNDSSITGFAIQALKAALAAGVPVPESLVVGAVRHFRRLTLEDGTVQYADRGNRRFRPSAALLGVGLVSRLLLGLDQSDPIVRRQAERLASTLPQWSARASINNGYYAWYYGTLAAFLLGEDLWPRWNARMKQALLGSQIRLGCASGSWPTDSKWGPNGGRVYTTAINVLTLEIYYRYVPGYLRRARSLRRFWSLSGNGSETSIKVLSSRESGGK